MKKIFILIGFIVFFGCSDSLKIRLEELGILPKEQSREYLSHFANVTQSYKYYDQFETKSIIKVTYFSEPFLNAYLKERKKFMPDSEYEMLFDKERQIKKSTIRFFVSIYTPDQEYSNLKDNKKVWNIYLENERGEKIYPQSINKVTEPYQIISYFFPTLDTWAIPYYITFENNGSFVKNKENFRLVFKSVISYSEFKFKYE